ncbi:hypothetical protein FA95DRAFT_646932 [Auriscalpium vulgare]|uniref:Uncharacterized protein n=1 Tax=Auriscalpium vulgare TaxID=40419 RepID=A0ACB8S1L3_9AGAM|nr:hypothetical protein FA95DRAFT_646932 [Auriscalpium vulgare]
MRPSGPNSTPCYPQRSTATIRGNHSRHSRAGPEAVQLKFVRLRALMRRPGRCHPLSDPYPIRQHRLITTSTSACPVNVPLCSRVIRPPWYRFAPRKSATCSVTCASLSALGIAFVSLTEVGAKLCLSKKKVVQKQRMKPTQAEDHIKPPLSREKRYREFHANMASHSWSFHHDHRGRLLHTLDHLD